MAYTFLYYAVGPDSVAKISRISTDDMYVRKVEGSSIGFRVNFGGSLDSLGS